MINKNFQPFNPVVKEEEQEPLVAAAPSHTSIKDLAEEERPREKLLAKGANALTIHELLAILIGGGTTEKTAVELMQDIMADCEGKLVNLSRMDVEELMRYKGIGEAKALSIIAAAEIGRRRVEESVADLHLFDGAETVLKYMRPKIQDLTHEESWVLLLNNNSKLIRCVHLSSGGITETAVDIRMLFKHACLANATCIILVHNHPSGRINPSRADIELTQRVQKAGQVMNIRLIDHVIVTDSDYYSFAEQGKI